MGIADKLEKWFGGKPGVGVVSGGNHLPTNVAPCDLDTLYAMGMSELEALDALTLIDDALTAGFIVEPGWDAYRRQHCFRVEGQTLYSTGDARLRVQQLLDARVNGTTPPPPPPPPTPPTAPTPRVPQPPSMWFAPSREDAEIADHHAAYIIGSMMRHRPECLDYVIDHRAMENLKRLEPAAYDAMMKGAKDAHALGAAKRQPTTDNERIEAVRYACELIGEKFVIHPGDGEPDTYQVGIYGGLTLEIASAEVARITTKVRGQGWKPADPEHQDDALTP